MKDTDFDWMLTGSHSISAGAAAYFPDARTDSAARSLRRQIVRLSQTFCGPVPGGICLPLRVRS